MFGMEHITIFEGSELEEDVKRNKKKSGIPWSHCILYLHLLVLYILLFSIYFELENTKKTLQTFQMSILQLDLKEREDESGLMEESNSTMPFEPNMQRFRRDVNLLPENETIISLIDYDENVKSFSKRDTDTKIKKNKNQKNARGKNQKNMRGKNKKKHKRRRNHGFPRAAHFIGMNPQPVIKDEGILAPWIVHPNAISNDSHLETNMSSEGHGAIKIVAPGLYFIYAQVYYISEDSKIRNSFHIMLETAGEKRSIAQCATLSSENSKGELSCFTAVAHTLRLGDCVYLQQRERSRRIVMSPDRTFLGLILMKK